jgi:hypothetical protein
MQSLKDQFFLENKGLGINPLKKLDEYGDEEADMDREEAELNRKMAIHIANRNKQQQPEKELNKTKSDLVPAETLKLMSKADFMNSKGFILPSGELKVIAGRGDGERWHESFAQRVGVDGVKFENSYELVEKTGWIRWSPETASFSVYNVMTNNQLNLVKDIVTAYGFDGLIIECLIKRESIPDNEWGKNKYYKKDYIYIDNDTPESLNNKLISIQSTLRQNKSI